MAQLSLQGVVKTFGAVTAVDNVSLEIASGEFVTLVGASGCGKTTLLRIIAGFAKSDRGELFIDGKRVTFDAKEQIVLRCGKSSITLTRAGKILIRGAYLLNRSSGVNRIKGGSVQIN